MPKFTLPDGSVREFDKPVSVAELAQSIGAGQDSGRRDWTRTNDPHHVKVVL